MGATPLNLKNIQGDILLNGLPKKNETFFFFKIEDGHVKDFCKALTKVAAEITRCDATAAVRDEISKSDSLVPFAGANISFSMFGLGKMSTVLKKLDLSTGDDAFQAGMLSNAANLQDPVQPGTGKPAWEAPYLQPENIHGVILVAGSDPDTVKDKLERVQNVFNFPPGPSKKGKAFISEVTSVSGKVRPGEQKGHEHFGYMDGVSQPAVNGVDEKTRPQGQDSVPQGVILCGRDGDQKRPDWMLDGSFLTFRKLEQKVPEFNKFLVDASNELGTWSDQLGSRLVGRWKSGCPIALQSDFDDTNIGADPNQRNNFEFDAVGNNFRCPMGAHVRKTNPRGDIGRNIVNQFRILRRGIPYGEEVSDDPNGQRGLLFVCYQSNIEKGFNFIQKTWANTPGFFTPNAGLDAIVGQSNSQTTVPMKGLFPQDADRTFNFNGINQFVIPRGGEYFFSPSLSALTNTLAAVATEHHDL